jgi:hypothetical protein
VLRIQDGAKDARKVLLKAFGKLYGIYGTASFDVTISCNAVLEGIGGNSWTLWFGHDFAAGKTHDFMMGEVHRVDSLEDVHRLPLSFTTADFQELFDTNFENSSVRVYSLASIVYKITRLMENYGRDRTVGQKFTKLF